MARILKAHWLVLLAVLSIAGLMGTSAFAEEEEEEGGTTVGKIVAFEFPLLLDGTDIAAGTNAFTLLGEEIKCPDSSYSGEVQEATPSEFTITPTYNNCTSGGGDHKVTITMNGCDYLFHIEKTTTTIEDNFFTSFDLLCPSGKDVEIHKYLNKADESVQVCKITIEEQKGIKRAKLTTVTSGGDIELESSFTNIIATRSGSCGAEKTTTGKYDVKITFTGTNKAKEPRNFKIID